MSEASDKPCVLVAEDEALLRMVAVEFLEDAGCTVLEAADGEQALESLKQNPGVKLLVSDIRMPRINGYQLVEQGLALRPDLKVLLMTGYTQDPVPENLTSRGVAIIYKPFDEGRFVAMAKGMLATG
jgi:CheY-like chemotaxis protein